MTQSLRLVLAERLRDLMATTPLTSQHKVGHASGVAQSTIGRIANGEVSATLDNIEAIAAAFGVSPVALLTAPADASGALATLAALLEPLPHAALEQVLGYVRFVAVQYRPPAKRVRPASTELNAKRKTENSDAERGVIQRGARAPSDPAKEFSKNAKPQPKRARTPGRRV